MTAFDEAISQVLKEVTTHNPVHNSQYNCYADTPPLYDHGGEWVKEPMGVVWYHPRTNNVFVVVAPQQTVQPLEPYLADRLKEGVMAYYADGNDSITTTGNPKTFHIDFEKWMVWVEDEGPIQAPELPVKKVTKPRKPKKKLADNLLSDVPSLL